MSDGYKAIADEAIAKLGETVKALDEALKRSERMDALHQAILERTVAIHKLQIQRMLIPSMN